MPSDSAQRKALEFFARFLQSQEAFSKQDFSKATGWSGNTLKTHWSKQFKPFVIPIGSGQYRVSVSFRPYANWKRFQRHVSQSRPVAADYKRIEFDNVVIYEFFMPLTNETPLRTTLDALFFRDNVSAKLRAIGVTRLSRQVSIRDGESQSAYLERICNWIDDHFGGYSIYHVNGRFRASKLLTREEAAEIEKMGQRYLIDETTAVSRFIFPCKDTNEADLVRYFFDALFAQSIIQLVNAEDEIWMVESGMKSRVHIWRVP
ncbi:MAG: hypothetical protein HUU46_02170 [Candidatus Hydrogenedentes bacterium]|nr:hypothetical protein [Candidatus Hydrogenedentota bacterium]